MNFFIKKLRKNLFPISEQSCRLNLIVMICSNIAQFVFSYDNLLASEGKSPEYPFLCLYVTQFSKETLPQAIDLIYFPSKISKAFTLVVLITFSSWTQVFMPLLNSWLNAVLLKAPLFKKNVLKKFFSSCIAYIFFLWILRGTYNNYESNIDRYSYFYKM